MRIFAWFGLNNVLLDLPDFSFFKTAYVLNQMH